MALFRGMISSLTLITNQCLIVLKNEFGTLMGPYGLLTTHSNYNSMMASILLASSNGYQVEINSSGANIVEFIKVIIMYPENWPGDNAVSIGKGEEERDDVDTAETV